MLLSKRTRLSLLTILICLGSTQANAAFINVVSTPTSLTGSFDANGFGSNLFVKNTDSNGLMPGDEFSQLLQTIVIPGEQRAFLLTPTDGTPDDPEANCTGVIGACGAVTGSYTNAANGETVNFAYTNLVFDGTRFTGDFSFEVSEVPLPAAAWLFASALLGLGLSKKSRAKGRSIA